MTASTLTLTAPVKAGGTITVPMALNDGDVLTVSVKVPVPAPAPVWTFGAPENGTFTLPTGSFTVRYGANSTYVTKVMSGKVACNNTTFGDPLKGTVKHCDYQKAPVVTPPPTPTNQPGQSGVITVVP